MMQTNKKRRLSELKDKILQTGYNEDEFREVCECHNENKRWTLQNLMGIIACQGYTETDISNYYKQKKLRTMDKVNIC